MHGVRANRLSQVERARLFRAAGYDVLLFDFQAHGESPGELITFGYLESRDAEAALSFLRDRFPGRPLAAIGTSLGGASLALAHHPLPLDALVLESVYPTIDEAVADRLAVRFGPLGRPLAPLLLLQIEPRLGVPKSVLRPIDHLADIGCPLLMLAGTADRHTTPEETERLYAAAREPKESLARARSRPRRSRTVRAGGVSAAGAGVSGEGDERVEIVQRITLVLRHGRH